MTANMNETGSASAPDESFKSNNSLPDLNGAIDGIKMSSSESVSADDGDRSKEELSGKDCAKKEGGELGKEGNEIDVYVRSRYILRIAWVHWN